jgi:hypothetical protein
MIVCEKNPVLFKADALEYLRLTGHPKADDLYEKAWSKSHSSGLYSVMNEMEDLAVLVS